MSAILPTTKFELKVGPHRMIVLRFPTVSDGDTWASGLNKVCTQPALFCNTQGEPSAQGNVGTVATFLASDGSVTFDTGTDGLATDLMVIY
jgi:hypothetical protein